jgi:hypothetical protein
VRVTFIPNPVRTSYELAKSYRPNTMERLWLISQLEWVLLKRFPLERSQHANQRGESNETALHELVIRIESALGQKIFALGAFLNVEGAFDNTSFEAMGKAYADHEVQFTISRWIAAMLSNRMVQAEIRGVS